MLTDYTPLSNSHSKFLFQMLGKCFDFSRKSVIGGMGEVYPCLIKHSKDDYVAIKTSKDRPELFRQEILFSLKLDYHPNVVRALTAYQEDNHLFLLMEWVGSKPKDLHAKLAGNTLYDFMKFYEQSCYAQTKTGSTSPKGSLQSVSPFPFPFPNHEEDFRKQALCWLIQACDGLTFLHQNGLKAHRDIKPNNFLISQDGVLKVSDFGLAFSPTQKYGRAEYAAPEVLAGAEPNMQSDIYALGIVLYQLFNHNRLPQQLTQTNSSSTDSDIPLAASIFADEIFQKCCAKNPRKRYTSFSQLRADLEKKAGFSVLPTKPVLPGPEIYALKAEGFCLMEDYPNAIKYMEKAKEKNLPLGFYQYFILASAHDELQHFWPAISAAQTAKKMAENSQHKAACAFLIGKNMLYLPKEENMDFKEYSGTSFEETAAEELTEAIELGLDFGIVRFYRGLAHAKLHKADLAMKDFNLAQKLGYKDPELFFWRGILEYALYNSFMELGLPITRTRENNQKAAQQALADLNRALETKRYKTPLLYKLTSDLYLDLNQPKAAYEALKWAVRYASQDSQKEKYALALGELCLKLNKKERGIWAFQTVLKLNPKQAGHIELLCYEAEKDSWLEELGL